MPFDTTSSTDYLYGRSDKRSGLLYLRINKEEKDNILDIFCI